MDLGTVKKKIKSKEYTTMYACGDDVRLVWSNCMTYNADGSDFYVLAQSLHKKWDASWSKFLQDNGNTIHNNNNTSSSNNNNTGGSSSNSAVANSTNGGGEAFTNSTSNSNNLPASSSSSSFNDVKVTLQEKKNLAKLFYQITKEDLGKVLIEIERKCPVAIKRNSSEDELELNMDLIDSKTMSDLMTFVQSYVCHWIRVFFLGHRNSRMISSPIFVVSICKTFITDCPKRRPRRNLHQVVKVRQRVVAVILARNKNRHRPHNQRRRVVWTMYVRREKSAASFLKVQDTNGGISAKIKDHQKMVTDYPTFVSCVFMVVGL
jgi:Bromodomain/Bromodomain extra-terminal - transcription regulation